MGQKPTLKSEALYNGAQLTKAQKKAEALNPKNREHEGFTAMVSPMPWFRRAQVMNDELNRKYKFQFEDDSALGLLPKDKEIIRNLLKICRSHMVEIRKHMNAIEPIIEDALKDSGLGVEIKEMSDFQYVQIVLLHTKEKEFLALVEATQTVIGNAYAIEAIHRRVMPLVVVDALNNKDLIAYLEEQRAKLEEYEKYLEEQEKKRKAEEEV